MKLCVYCGTFNPIHNVHLEVANFVKNKFQFDKILFIPAYKPPHKNLNGKLAIHRYNMVTLALMDSPNFCISDIEYKREDYSYTVNTIEELYSYIHGIEGRISFIIGTDAFKGLNTWHKIDRLKEMVEFIVFPRENNFSEGEMDKYKDEGYHFVCVDKPFVDVSSTMVRERVKSGEDISNLVPQKVKEYIYKNRLYTNEK